jgi:hypothetical protein
VQGLRSESESRQQFLSADRKSTAPAFQAREHSIPSPDANDVLRKFNRDSHWVAAGLLGTVLLAASALVVLLPERHTMTPVPSQIASPAEDIKAQAQKTQNDADLAANQHDEIQAQLKDTNAQQIQKSDGLAVDALQAQAKDTDPEAQQAQNDAELVASQRDALQAQLKDTEAKTRQAQNDAELVASQRDALQAQLKDTEAKTRQAQNDAELVASQRDALQAQLKDTEAKTQQAQNDAEPGASQRDALQASYQPNSAGTFRRKASHQSHRSVHQLGDAEAKRLLLELWHRSLAKTEKPLGWPTFSNLDERKKAAFISGRRSLLPRRHRVWP